MHTSKHFSLSLHVVIAFLILGFEAVTLTSGLPLWSQTCTVATWVLERANALGDFDSTDLIYLKVFRNIPGYYLCP